MTDQTYTITLADIDAYLATKQDDEVIGVSGNACKCLVTEALTWKYHLQPTSASVDGERAAIYAGTSLQNEFELSGEIQQLIADFDMIGGPFCRSVTKREWLESQEVNA